MKQQESDRSAEHVQNLNTTTTVNVLAFSWVSRFEGFRCFQGTPGGSTLDSRAFSKPPENSKKISSFPLAVSLYDHSIEVVTSANTTKLNKKYYLKQIKNDNITKHNVANFK